MQLSLGPVGIWTAALDYQPLAEAQRNAAELEKLGYDAIWLPEVAGRDVILHLGMLLAATTNIVVASGVANIWARDAVSMTGAAKALTEAFPERALIGLGVSHHSLVVGLRGHTYQRPLAAMESYLDAMDASPYVGFRPATPVRIVLAALGPRMLALGAARSCGAHTYFVPPEHTAAARGILGNDALLCVEQAVVMETEPARAREIARTHTRTYLDLPNYRNNLSRLGYDEADFGDGGSDRLVDAIVAWGDDATALSRLEAHFDAGADHVCIQVIDERRRGVPLEEWRRLAPGVRELAARVGRRGGAGQSAR